MKVYIGKFPKNYNIYFLSNILKKLGIKDETVETLEENYIEPFLKDTWFDKLLQWINTKNGQRIKVRIDPWDTWGMDYTLSHIIVPMLKQLKKTKHGAPFVDDDDVPDELKSTSAPPKEKQWDIDENHFKRWDYVLDEMIWAFEQKTLDDNESQFFDHSEIDETQPFTTQMGKLKVDREGLKKHKNRMDNGFRLFGKYYSSLWD